MIFKAIPQISMEQQQSEQQVFDLEKSQKTIQPRKYNKIYAKAQKTWNEKRQKT
jgi:hypothetical protein